MTCWLLVRLLMYKCVNNIVPTRKGEIFIYSNLFYKLKKVKDVLNCDFRGWGWENTLTFANANGSGQDSVSFENGSRTLVTFH